MTSRTLREFLTVDARTNLFTGIVFSRGKTPLYLHLRQGQLINIESWDPSYSLAAFAFKSGLTTVEEYDRLRTAQIETGERLVELLKKESRADHTTILRLHESFAYLTLLHLIVENAPFTAVEGAVSADPILLEAISPERFTERLAALADAEKGPRILALWQGDLAVDDPACGLESGPAAAAFLHTGRRFPEQYEFLEKTLNSPTAAHFTPAPRHEGTVAALGMLMLVALLLLVALFYADRLTAAQEERDTARRQIEKLRVELHQAAKTVSALMRVR